MFVSANEPGNIKKVQASVTAARKVFRVMRVRFRQAVQLCTRGGCFDLVNCRSMQCVASAAFMCRC